MATKPPTRSISLIGSLVCPGAHPASGARTTTSPAPWRPAASAGLKVEQVKEAVAGPLRLVNLSFSLCFSLLNPYLFGEFVFFVGSIAIVEGWTTISVGKTNMFSLLDSIPIWRFRKRWVPQIIQAMTMTLYRKRWCLGIPHCSETIILSWLNMVFVLVKLFKLQFLVGCPW